LEASGEEGYCVAGRGTAAQRIICGVRDFKIIDAKSGGEAIIIAEGTMPALVTELMRRKTCRTDY
jgi:hypothetical protein